jgi:hypothetical protein
MLNATAWTTARVALHSHRPRVDDFVQVTAGQVRPHHPGGGVFVMGRLFLLDHLVDHFPLLQSQHLPDAPSTDYPSAITREEIKSALAEVERKPRSAAQADDEMLFTSTQDNENLTLTLAMGVYGAIRASEASSSEEQTRRLRAMATAFPYA